MIVFVDAGDAKYLRAACALRAAKCVAAEGARAPEGSSAFDVALPEAELESVFEDVAYAREASSARA